MRRPLAIRETIAVYGAVRLDVVHVFGWLPGLRAVRGYRREWLAKDVTAGIVLTTLLVPQGMAYAELAGLPAITGLYTSIMCLLGYAVFGPSRILVLGPDSALGPMIAATILPLAGADGDPKRAIALASLLAIMVAAIMIIGAVAKVGFIADLISKPTMIGYMNGLAITIIVGQLPKLTGFKIDAKGLIREAAAVVRGLANGEAVAAAAAVGIAGIILILVLQRWLPKLPAVLIMVVLSIAATTLFHLGDHGVSLVGVLPKGFPPLTIPHVELHDLGPLFGGALGIALVSLADTISTASAFAARTGQEINGNQEMVGIGAANLAAGLFQGFPISTSGSRTAVAERSGAKSQLTGVVGAVLITLMIVLLPGLFRNLPNPALAAVVITASLSLADIPGTARLWKQRKAEFALSIAAFLGVALLGVLPGIAIAVGLSILNVFGRAWWPYSTELGRVEALDSYHDVHMHPEAERLPGLVIYRFDAPLFFANATTFRDEIRRLAAAAPPPTWIVIAAEPMTDVDTTASDVLEELDEKLNAEGISLIFAELKDTVRGKIERYGLTRTINPEHFFPTIEAAVTAYQRETGVDWPEGATPPLSPRAPLSLHCVRSSHWFRGVPGMSVKRHVMTAVAALAVVAATSCSSSTSGGSVTPAAASHVSALATSSAVAKAKQEATACVQKTGTGALLSSAGRTQLVNCLKGLVPADKLTAFKSCVTTAAKNDKLWTKAGRTKFADTSVPNCVDQVA